MHKVAVGWDPNAGAAKDRLVVFLRGLGYQVTDMGGEDPIYANAAIKTAQAVAKGECDRGILLCGTGIGMAISANKVKGAYAALVSDVYSAKRARLSNDANIACFGVFTLGEKHIEELAQAFLTSEYEPGGPSQAKIDRFREYEQGR